MLKYVRSVQEILPVQSVHDYNIGSSPKVYQHKLLSQT